MTEILFPSRLSNEKSYHRLVICCIVTNNSCIKKHAIIKKSYWNYEKLSRIAGLAFGS